MARKPTAAERALQELRRRAHTMIGRDGSVYACFCEVGADHEALDVEAGLDEVLTRGVYIGADGREVDVETDGMIIVSDESED